MKLTVLGTHWVFWCLLCSLLPAKNNQLLDSGGEETDVYLLMGCCSARLKLCNQLLVDVECSSLGISRAQNGS